MRVLRKHQDFFAQKMNELADAFNEVFSYCEGQKTQAQEAMPQLVNLVSLGEKLAKKFTDLGYTDRQWNNLLASSGAAEKMGAYSGALRRKSFEQFEKEIGTASANRATIVQAFSKAANNETSRRVRQNREDAERARRAQKQHRDAQNAEEAKKARDAEFAHKTINGLFVEVKRHLDATFAESQRFRAEISGSEISIDLQYKTENHAQAPMAKDHRFGMQAHVKDGKLFYSSHGNMIDPQYRGRAREVSPKEFLEKVSWAAVHFANNTELRILRKKTPRAGKAFP